MANINERVAEFIENMSDDDQIQLHNNYVQDISAEDGISQMSDLDELCEGQTPTEIIQSLSKDFSTSHSYVYFDGAGKLNSFNRTSDDNSPISISDLTNWIVRNDYFHELEYYGFIYEEDEE